jgi:tetratricopeptide (TPR) repeat protein
MESRIEELLPTMGYSQEYRDALFLLCERFYVVGRFDDAETLAYELRLLMPRDTKIFKLSAAIQAGKGNYLFAYNCYWNGIKVNENDPELWIGLGQSAIHLDRLRDAMEALDKTIALTEKDPELNEHARKLKNLIQ